MSKRQGSVLTPPIPSTDHTSESFESGVASVESLTIGDPASDLDALERMFADGGAAEPAPERAPAAEEADLSLFPAVATHPPSPRGGGAAEAAKKETPQSSGLAFLMGP